MWSSGTSIYWRRNTGGALAAAATLHTEAYPELGIFEFATHAGGLDANGDGRADAIGASQGCYTDPMGPGFCANYYTLLIATGSGYAELLIEATPQAEVLANFRAIDINGDGLDDVLYTRGGTWRFRLSTGQALEQLEGNTNIPASVVLIADYDNDGRGDLIRQDGNYWNIHRSNGSTLSPSATESLYSPFGYSPFAVDVSGDGFPEIVQNTLVGGNGYWHTHKHQSALPDVVTAVVDGLGYRVEVDYESLSNSTHHTQASTNTPPAPYVRKFRGARYVVTQERRDTGLAFPYPTQRTFDHHYDSAWIETGGRGSFSFYRRINYDLETGTHTQTYYHQVFPYFGIPTWSGLMRSSDGQVARAVATTMGQSTWPATTPARRFVRVEYSTKYEYEVGGPANGAYLRRIEENPEYETSYGRLLSTATETYEIGNGANWTSYTTFSPLTPDANWCLNRRGLVTTTNTLFDRVTTEQRKVNHTWNGCQLYTITDESESDPTKQLRTTFTSYDPFGNPNVVTRDSVAGSGEPRTVDYDFDQWGQFPASETLVALNLATSFTWDYATGQRASVTPPDGLTTQWQFDPFGRVSAQIGPGPDTTITYSACSPSCWAPHAVFQARAQGADGSDDYTFFDELGRAVGESWKLPLGNEGRQSTLFDAAGRVDSVSKPYVNGQPVFATGWTYDVIGRVTLQDEPLSETQPSGAHTAYQYEGMSTRVTRNGEDTTYVHNGLGQIKRVTDALNGASTYSYRPFGELWQVTDAESYTTTVTYDLRGHKTRLVDPNMGTWDYEHNAFGELMRQKSPVTTASACGATGIWTVCLDYDQAGRLESRSEAEGTTSWTYYATGDGAKGRLDTVTGPGHALKYTYSPVHGLPTEVRHTLDGTNYFYNFAYNDPLARLEELTYPTSTSGYRFKVNYDFDEYGHLRVAKDGNSPFAPFYTLTQADALDRDVELTLGSGTGAVNEVFDYDLGTGRIQYIETGKNYGTEIQNLAFTFDEAGNLATRENLNIGRTETVVPDALNRVYSAQVNGGPVISLSYSASGRILSKSDVGSYSYTGGCGGGPYAVKSAGGQSFCYDAAGRMTSRAGQTLSWTSYDLPSVLRAAGNQSSELSYGVDRARYKQVRKTGSTVDATILYIGGLLEKETAGGTTTWRHYVSARGRTVAQVLRTGSTNTVQYLHRDHQGSVVEVTNSSGTLVQSLAFDAWGLRRNPANWLALASPFGGTQPTKRGYTGHEHLDNVELVHMNGRVQDPKLGRFLSADPFVQAPYHSQSLDRYSYVWNNPMSLVDPSGFQGNCDDPLAPCPITPIPVDPYETLEWCLGNNAACDDRYANYDDATRAAAACATNVAYCTSSTVELPQGAINHGGPSQFLEDGTRTTLSSAGAAATTVPGATLSAAEYREALSVAWWALNKYNPRSVRDNREYAGVIYRDATGRFIATEAFPGPLCTPAGCMSNTRPAARLVPRGGDIILDYHTHGPGGPGLTNEWFSEGDHAGINSDGRDARYPHYVGGVLGTPGGQAYFYPAGALPDTGYTNAAMQATQILLGRIAR
jgi:RHS repeat-associated protein